jgi:hypothetical protein
MEQKCCDAENLKTAEPGKGDSQSALLCHRAA